MKEGQSEKTKGKNLKLVGVGSSPGLLWREGNAHGTTAPLLLHPLSVAKSNRTGL